MTPAFRILRCETCGKKHAVYDVAGTAAPLPVRWSLVDDRYFCRYHGRAAREAAPDAATVRRGSWPRDVQRALRRTSR